MTASTSGTGSGPGPGGTPAAGPGPAEPGRPASTGPDGSAAAVPARGAFAVTRHHAALVVAVLVGAVLRGLVYLGYGPAFFVWPDSGVYLSGARTGVPGQIWPYGYSIPLALLRLTGRIATVSAVQHLAGLVMAVALYALLYRAGLPRWLATVAVLPVLLDAQEIVIEHYLLAETAFTVALVAAVLLVAGPGFGTRRPGVWRCLVAGLLLAYAAVTRTAGLPVVVLPLLYLLIRRVGWRALTAFAVALVAPLAGYLLWYHQAHGVYAFNQAQGRFLWARTTSFVDCGRVALTPAERALCPADPPGHRTQPDKYLWEGASAPMYREPAVDPVYASFAGKAIMAQPGGYLTTVARDTYHFFDPFWRLPGRTACVGARWQLPAGPSGLPSCRPKAAATDFSTTVYAPDGALRATDNRPVGTRSTPVTRALHAYSTRVTTPRLLLLLAAVLAVVLALARPRRVGWPGLGGLLLVGCGSALILVATATSAIDPRYAVPALPLVFPGTALVAWRALRGGAPPSARAADPSG